MSNHLIISSAGSGKTTSLVQRALEITTPVLITTFTEANESEIKKRFLEINGYVPSNVTIQTWFSMLIQHGIKPYQGTILETKIRGLLLVNAKSGVKYYTKSRRPVYYKESEEAEKHYLSSGSKIYSDKVSKFVIRANKNSGDRVIQRLIRIYPNIFIDEAQDLAGYDLEIVKLLSKSDANLILVCDPRQTTYLTHHGAKHPNYRDGQIEKFILDQCSRDSFEIDKKSLSGSFRCNEKICSFSNQLYPEQQPSTSRNVEVTGHDGVFLVSKESLSEYLRCYSPVQLRWDVRTKGLNEKLETWNFGASKGLTFNRVIIYPTDDMISWMKDASFSLANGTRAKFYVGVTRARHSVAIVCDNPSEMRIGEAEIYDPNTNQPH